MSRASRLGKKLGSKFGGTLVHGTVINIDTQSERSIIEVELADGSMVNAVAWVQADIRSGDDVCLGRVHDGEHAIYTIVAANSPAVGLDPLDRDPAADLILYRGDSIRPPVLSKQVGGVKLINRTQQIARLNFNTYTQLRVFMDFTVAPLPGNNSKIGYWLYGYDITDTQLNNPGFKLEIGTTWRSNNNKRWRSIFDMSAPGAMGEWLYERNAAIFVLGVQRKTTSARGNDTGRFSRVWIQWGDIIDSEPIDLVGSSSLVANGELDEVRCDMSGSAELRLDQVWCDLTGTLYCEAVVVGPIVDANGNPL